MTKYARIVNNSAIDITDQNPATIFHPLLAQDFVEVPDYVENGATLVEGEWVNAIAPPLPPRTWTIDDFRSKMKLSEKVIWDGDTSPIVKTIKIELLVPVNVSIATELAQMLVDNSIISIDTMNNILS